MRRRQVAPKPQSLLATMSISAGSIAPSTSVAAPQPFQRMIPLENQQQAHQTSRTKPPSQAPSQPAADQYPTISDPFDGSELPNRDLIQVLDRKNTMSIMYNFIAWVNGELKRYLPADAIPPLYTLPTHVPKWTIDHVCTFLYCVGYPKMAEYCRKHCVDGLALLLFRAYDLTQVIGLQELPALRLFAILNRLHMNLFTVIIQEPQLERQQPKKRTYDSALGQP